MKYVKKRINFRNQLGNCIQIGRSVTKNITSYLNKMRFHCKHVLIKSKQDRKGYCRQYLLQRLQNRAIQSKITVQLQFTGWLLRLQLLETALNHCCVKLSFQFLVIYKNYNLVIFYGLSRNDFHFKLQCYLQIKGFYVNIVFIKH